MTLIKLIALYPPAWRRRYGRELEELISTQPASFRTAIDLIAGAVDAWLNPQSSTAASAADPKGAAPMVFKMVQLRYAGGGPNVTAADHLKAAAVTIGGTLVLVLPLVGAIRHYGRDHYLFSYLLSLMTASWLVPYLLSQRYTTFKGRPGRVQALLIGGPVATVIAIALAAVWLSKP